MALALDATTPARVTATTTAATTASFTPPANALLVVCSSFDAGNGASPTVTITNTGTGIGTWTAIGQANRTTTSGGAGIDGGASMHWAKVNTSVATTVTATQSLGATPTSIKVYVITGADTTTPVGANNIGNSTANTLVTTSITTTAANSYVVASATEWTAPGTAPTSSDLNVGYDAYTQSTNLDGGSGMKLVTTSGTATTCTIDCAGTAAAEWTYVTAEIKVAGGTAYTASPADSEGITDSGSAVQDMVRAPADSVGLTDSGSPVQDLVRAPGDSLGLTDSASVIQAQVLSPADALGLTDSASFTADVVQSQADAVGITDSVSAVLTGAGAITLQGTPTLYENASATSVVVPYPTGTASGEVLLLHVADSATTISTTPPTGFTLATSDQNANTPSVVCFYRVADGTESGSVTWSTGAAAGRVTGMMERWSGVDNTTPLDVAAVHTDSGVATTFTMPSITTVTANAMLVHQISLNAASAADIVTLSGTTLIQDTTGTGRRQGTYYETLATAGASGTRTWSDTPATALQWGGITVALRPGSSGTAYSKTPADAEGITDSATFVQTQQLSLSDSAGVTDSAVAAQDIVRAQSDSLGLTDSAAVNVDVVRAPADAQGITDSASALQGLIRTPADPVGISDATTVLQAQALTASDSVGITDSATAVLNAGGTAYTATPADNVGISDAALQGLDAVRSNADSVGLTDAVAISAGVVQNLADSVGLTDSPSVTISAARSLTDSVGLTDAAAQTADAVRVGADSAGLTDTVSSALDAQRSAADIMGLTDSVTARLDRVVNVSDSIGITDLARQSGATRDLTVQAQAQQPRLSIAAQVSRLSSAVLSRFSLALPQRFSVAVPLTRFSLYPLGGMMTTTIHVSKGEIQYAGGTITETTGKDISAATYQVSLGSADVPGTGATPDRNSAGASNNIRIVSKLINNTVPLGHYWVWIHVGDNPENILLPVQEIIVA